MNAVDQGDVDKVGTVFSEQLCIVGIDALYMIRFRKCLCLLLVAVCEKAGYLYSFYLCPFYGIFYSRFFTT